VRRPPHPVPDRLRAQVLLARAHRAQAGAGPVQAERLAVRGKVQRMARVLVVRVLVVRGLAR